MKSILVSFLLILSSLILKGQTDSCDYKKYFNKDGSIKEDGCLKNGKRNGLWNDYTEGTNKIRFIWTYKNDVKDGPYKALFDDGKIEAIGKYKFGSLDDTLKIFDRNGTLLQMEIWQVNKDGSKSTLIKTISLSDKKPDGTIEMEGDKMYIWKEGKKELFDLIPTKEDTKSKKKKKN